MAILQVSRIQVRQGRQIDLPQLSGGELGWSNDSRRLFIGNGTLDEGAPVIGNTEVLTEFSYQQLSGQYVRLAGVTAILVDNTSSPTVITDTNDVQLKINAATIPAFNIDYTITRGISTRTGTIRVATNTGGNLVYRDDGIENLPTGVSITVSQTLAEVSVMYTTTATGQDATIQYSVSYFK